MKSRKDTTRKLNLETLAKREVFAANVFASMALPVEKIDTTSLVGRFETATESSSQDVEKQKSQSSENQRYKQSSYQQLQNKRLSARAKYLRHRALTRSLQNHKESVTRSEDKQNKPHAEQHDQARFRRQQLSQRLSSKANALRDKLSTSELDSFKNSGRDLSRKGRLKGISEANVSGLNSNLGKGLNDSRSPLNNLSGRTSMGTSRNAAASSIWSDLNTYWDEIMGLTLSGSNMARDNTMSEAGEDTCLDEGLIFVASTTGAIIDVGAVVAIGMSPEPISKIALGAAVAGAAGSTVGAAGAWADLSDCVNRENNKTPDPRDRGTDSGRLIFSAQNVNGRTERMKKMKEIVSNSNGYGTAGPNPVADEKESGGPLQFKGNHDDGNNHIKQKGAAAGDIRDIVLKTGGGVTDPHHHSTSSSSVINEKPVGTASVTASPTSPLTANKIAARIDAVMHSIGR